jgi:myo-inositol catabolism protein IolC
MPSIIHAPGTSVPSSNSCFKHLSNLDGFMKASGYGDDHPWRTEIVSAVDACSDLDDVAEDIISDAETLFQLLDLAMTACADAANAAQIKAAILAARRYANDISGHACRLVGGAA